MVARSSEEKGQSTFMMEEMLGWIWNMDEMSGILQVILRDRDRS